MHNISGKTIPKYILETLQLGLSHSVGGNARKIPLMSSIDAFFENWKKYAENINLNRFQIFEVQAELRVLYAKLLKCNTKNKNVEKMKLSNQIQIQNYVLKR